MKLDLFDALLPVGLAVTFIAVGWCSIRLNFAGRAVPSHLKETLIYGFLFVLGNGYFMFLAAEANWPKTILFAAIGAWGVLLCWVAWWRYRRSRSANLRTPAP